MTRARKVRRLKMIDGAMYYPVPLTRDLQFPITEKITQDALMRFANDKEQGAKLYMNLGLASPADPVDITEAHTLLTEAFAAMVAHGAINRRTEVKVSAVLQGVRQEERFELDGGEFKIWRRIHFGSLTGYCAYMVALLVGFDVGGLEIRRCKLRECRRYFWSPMKRGRRPTYCSERHRVTGSKREQRGMQP